MAKLYVAKMVMIKPLFFYGNGAVKVITDDILVKKTAFGYKETLTGRSFKKGTYLKKNEGTYNCVSAPYILTDSSIAQKLEDGETQLLIDDFINEKYPIREASKEDIDTIVDNFEHSRLNQYYKDQQARKERKKQEKRSTEAAIKEMKKVQKQRRKQIKRG